MSEAMLEQFAKDIYAKAEDKWFEKYFAHEEPYRAAATDICDEVIALFETKAAKLGATDFQKELHGSILLQMRLDQNGTDAAMDVIIDRALDYID